MNFREYLSEKVWKLEGKTFDTLKAAVASVRNLDRDNDRSLEMLAKKLGTSKRAVLAAMEKKEVVAPKKSTKKPAEKIPQPSGEGADLIVSTVLYYIKKDSVAVDGKSMWIYVAAEDIGVDLWMSFEKNGFKNPIAKEVKTKLAAAGYPVKRFEVNYSEDVTGIVVAYT
jgi:hypothetical protein